MNHGFIRVAAAIPSVKVADVHYNVEQVKSQILEAEAKGVEVIVFPELTLTGYTCQDLFTQKMMIDEAEEGVRRLMAFTENKRVAVIVGVPVDTGKILLNCAVVISQGVLLNIIPKRYLPNYSEFYEKRWFASAQDFNDGELITYAGTTCEVHTKPVLFETLSGVRYGVEICEDVWAPVPPSNHLALAGADLIFNLSSSDELAGKHAYLKALLANQSARTICGYVYSSSGFGESTQDVVYGGNAIIFENGRLLAESERFSFSPQMRIADVDIDMLHAERRKNTTFVNAQRNEVAALLMSPPKAGMPAPSADGALFRTVSPSPFIPSTENMTPACEEILNIQVAGLAKRLLHLNCQTVVLGISGGLDSTLALLVCVRTFDKLGWDRKGIVGITMPGFGTSDRTYHNAIALMRELGITLREISIAKAVLQHFEDIGHDVANHDVTYENAQARERTQILMDVANQVNGLVIGTGDLSELALGWCTYNGDHMSMYAVNASVPKTLIQHLVRYVALQPASSEAQRSMLLDIVDTPISPELTPADSEGKIAQKTEDLVGPYELHDFFLFYTLRYGFRPGKIHFMAVNAFKGKYAPEIIAKWMKTFYRRFFTQQFKRSCLPDGPKVGSVSLSPRGDWRMPSDATATLWLKECDELA